MCNIISRLIRLRRDFFFSMVGTMGCLFASSALAAGSITRLIANGTPRVAAMSGDGAVVVGSAGGFPQYPYSWVSSTGSGTILPNDGTSFAFAEATGISGAGFVIAGYDESNFATSKAVVFESGTRYVLSSGGLAAYARGISRDGTTVVGQSGTTAAIWTGTWSTGGTRASLPGVFNTSTAKGTDVNGDGTVIAGNEKDGNTYQRSVLWTKSGGVYSAQLLGGLGGDYEEPTGISSDGQVVVGFCLNPSSEYRAFRWTQAGGTQDLGNLPGALAGAEAEAYGVNSDGSIVVGLADNSSGNRSAFRWTAASGMVDLNQWLPTQGVDLTGWTLERALAINDDGSVMAGQGQFNGAPAGWVVNVAAVPEPSTWAMGAAGLVCGGWQLLRRRKQA
jgi:probable HAF family extracellular repeat protein